jgi:hypothetical protein
LEFVGSFVIASYKDRGAIYPAQDIDTILQAAVHVREITRADDNIDSLCPLDKALGRRSIDMEIEKKSNFTR